MRAPVTYVLKDPITFGNETIAELTFRPLKAKDLRGVQNRDGYETDFMLALAVRLSGKSTPVIDELSAEDMQGVASIITGFLSGSPTTGSERSP